jgi:hypothetical protein
MKHYIVLLSTIIFTLSFAMEHKTEIISRNLNTPQRPHITIINQLPKEIGFSTRIDISDTTKINNTDDYKPDDSTKTIHSDKGIKFSPNFNKTGEPEYRRLGMNNTGNAALIALYIHGIKNSLVHMIIGEGSRIQFGDTVTITTQSHKPNHIFINVESPSKELEKLLYYYTCGYGNGFFIDNPKEDNNYQAKLIGQFTHPDILECSSDYEEYLENHSYIKALLDEHNKEQL